MITNRNFKGARGRRPGILVAGALLVAACGDGSDTADAASQAVETTSAETSSTTAASSTTTETTATTVESTTTTEPPVPGSAAASGESIESMEAAVGSIAPTISGVDYLSVEEVSWVSGTPRAILFAPLADWCPHCSIHLEQLGTYLADDPDPTSANVLLVTLEEQPSAQYPQTDWLTEVGWSNSTVLDTLDFSISNAFGVTSVPTWFLVGSDGVIVNVVDGHHVSPSDVFEMINNLE